MSEEKWITVEKSDNGKIVRWNEKPNDKQKDKTVYVGNKISGVYVDKREGVGKNKGVIYVIDTKDHGLLALWDTKVLSQRFSEVPVGSEVKVTMVEIKESKGGKEYFDFDLKYRPTAMKTAGAKEKANPEEIAF